MADTNQPEFSAWQRQLALLRRTEAEWSTAGMPEANLATLRTQIADLQAQLAAAGVELSTAASDTLWRDKHVHGDDVAGDKVAGHKILATLQDGSRLIGGDAHGLMVVTEGGVQVSLAPGDVPAETLLAAYYRSLASETCRLPLGVIDAEFVRTSGEHPQPLPDVYVDLDTIVSPAEMEQKEDVTRPGPNLRGTRTGRTALLEALTRPENHLTVLLGEVGSGKSTFINYLTYMIVSGKPDLPAVWQHKMVMRLTLREVAARHIPANTHRGTAGMLWNALREDMASYLGAASAEHLLQHVQATLLQKGGIVLLDGLDEVPEPQRRRKALLEAVTALVQNLPAESSRVLVTARPYAYADKEWWLSGFATMSLARLGTMQVNRFVDRWYQAVRTSMQWSEETARGKAVTLQAILTKQPYLADLASRPLLLTLMATLHSSWGTLPDDRAGLYEQTVELLLKRWQHARKVCSSDGQIGIEQGIGDELHVSEDQIRNALQELAFTAHKRQRQHCNWTGESADISEGEVLVAFKSLLGAVHPDTLLCYLQQRAGLLVERKERTYGFAQQPFQEYLAACYLANQGDFAEQLQKLLWEDPLWWREVALLSAGKAKQGGLGSAVALLNVLLPDEVENIKTPTDTYWRVAAIVGTAVHELRLAEKAAGQRHYEVMLHRARRWLTQLVEGGHLSPLDRATAADTLSWIGDSRFDPDHWYLPKEPLLGFVEIPESPFRVGLGREQILPRYYIARFPVTVAQWRAFVDQHKQSGAFPRFESEPGNYPVNGVRLKQAAEYCGWLTECLREWLGTPQPLRSLLAQDNWLITLPTEQQWEKAARASHDWIYPWGNEPDPGRANYRDTSIGRVVAVGCFPGGASPYGVHDMAGSVSEWTRSGWSDGGPVHPDILKGQSGDSVALRGGTPNSTAENIRCDARHHAYSSYGLDGFGFRTVLTRV
jgi:formylglycine-generating enzyme required for sulfatase activity